MKKKIFALFMCAAILGQYVQPTISVFANENADVTTAAEDVVELEQEVYPDLSTVDTEPPSEEEEEMAPASSGSMSEILEESTDDIDEKIEEGSEQTEESSTGSEQMEGSLIDEELSEDEALTRKSNLVFSFNPHYKKKDSNGQSYDDYLEKDTTTGEYKLLTNGPLLNTAVTLQNGSSNYLEAGGTLKLELTNGTFAPYKPLGFATEASLTNNRQTLTIKLKDLTIGAIKSLTIGMYPSAGLDPINNPQMTLAATFTGRYEGVTEDFEKFAPLVFNYLATGLDMLSLVEENSSSWAYTSPRNAYTVILGQSNWHGEGLTAQNVSQGFEDLSVKMTLNDEKYWSWFRKKDFNSATFTPTGGAPAYTVPAVDNYDPTNPKERTVYVGSVNPNEITSVNVSGRGYTPPTKDAVDGEVAKIQFDYYDGDRLIYSQKFELKLSIPGNTLNLDTVSGASILTEDNITFSRVAPGTKFSLAYGISGNNGDILTKTDDMVVEYTMPKHVTPVTATVGGGTGVLTGVQYRTKEMIDNNSEAKFIKLSKVSNEFSFENEAVTDWEGAEIRLIHEPVSGAINLYQHTYLTFKLEDDPTLVTTPPSLPTFIDFEFTASTKIVEKDSEGNVIKDSEGNPVKKNLPIKYPGTGNFTSLIKKFKVVSINEKISEPLMSMSEFIRPGGNVNLEDGGRYQAGDNYFKSYRLAAYYRTINSPFIFIKVPKGLKVEMKDGRYDKVENTSKVQYIPSGLGFNYQYAPLYGSPIKYPAIPDAEKIPAKTLIEENQNYDVYAYVMKGFELTNDHKPAMLFLEHKYTIEEDMPTGDYEIEIGMGSLTDGHIALANTLAKSDGTFSGYLIGKSEGDYEELLDMTPDMKEIVNPGNTGAIPYYSKKVSISVASDVEASATVEVAGDDDTYKPIETEITPGRTIEYRTSIRNDSKNKYTDLEFVSIMPYPKDKEVGNPDEDLGSNIQVNMAAKEPVLSTDAAGIKPVTGAKIFYSTSNNPKRFSTTVIGEIGVDDDWRTPEEMAADGIGWDKIRAFKVKLAEGLAPESEIFLAYQGVVPGNATRPGQDPENSDPKAVSHVAFQFKSGSYTLANQGPKTTVRTTKALNEGKINGYVYRNIGKDGKFDSAKGDIYENDITLEIYAKNALGIYEHMTDKDSVTTNDGETVASDGLFGFVDLPLGADKMYKICLALPKGVEGVEGDNVVKENDSYWLKYNNSTEINLTDVTDADKEVSGLQIPIFYYTNVSGQAVIKDSKPSEVASGLGANITVEMTDSQNNTKTTKTDSRGYFKLEGLDFRAHGDYDLQGDLSTVVDPKVIFHDDNKGGLKTQNIKAGSDNTDVKIYLTKESKDENDDDTTPTLDIYIDNAGSKTVNVNPFDIVITADDDGRPVTTDWKITKGTEVIKEVTGLKGGLAKKINLRNELLELYKDKDNNAGKYQISATVTDILGKSSRKTPRLFKTDVKEFEIEFGTVTFEGEGVVEPDVKYTIYHEKIDAPTTEPKLMGYEFTGWIDQKTKKYFSFSEIIEEPKVTLVAEFKPLSNNKLTYDLNGGSYQGNPSIPEGTNITTGETITLPEAKDMFKAGDMGRFVGWERSDDKKIVTGNTLTMPGKDLTLTAQWANTQSKVKFEVDQKDRGYNIPATKKYNVGSKLSLENIYAKRKNATFKGWSIKKKDGTTDNKIYAVSFDIPEEDTILVPVFSTDGEDSKDNSPTVEIEIDGKLGDHTNPSKITIKPNDKGRPVATTWEIKRGTEIIKSSDKDGVFGIDPIDLSKVLADEIYKNPNTNLPAGTYTVTATVNEGVNKAVTANKDFNILVGTATYKADDNVDQERKYFVYRDRLENIAGPARKGYTFKYWKASEGANQSFNFNQVIESDNITLFAEYKAKEYDLAFDFGNGSHKNPDFIKAIKLETGQSVTLPTADEMVGQEPNARFLGWKVQGKNGYISGTEYRMPGFDEPEAGASEPTVTLVADWGNTSSQLTFVAENEAVIIVDEKALEGEKTEEDGKVTGFAITDKVGQKIDLNNITAKKAHADFVGWKDDNDTIYEANSEIEMPADKTTLTAQFKDYTKDEIDNGKNNKPTIDVNIDSRENSNNSLVNPDGVTITAEDGTNPVTVDWKISNDIGLVGLGADVAPTDIKAELERVIKDIYLWKTKGTYKVEAVARDVLGQESEIVTKTFEVHVGTATYYTEIDGVTNDFAFEKYIVYRDTLTGVDKPKIPGYTFTNWREYGQSTDFDFESIVRKDVIMIEAILKQKQYTVKFKMNGGTYDGSSNDIDKFVKTGATVEIPDKGKMYQKNKDFVSWKSEDGTKEYLKDFEMPGLADDETELVLEAQWKTSERTITFELGEDEEKAGNLESITKPIGEKISLKGKVATKDGYEFIGWIDKLDKSEKPIVYLESINMPEENITLVAAWKAEDQIITFDSNNGTIVDDIVKPTGEKVDLSKEAVSTRSGYTFAGWFDAAGKKHSGDFPMPVGGLALKAKWSRNNVTPPTPNEKTITFDVNDGTLKAGLSKTMTKRVNSNVDISDYYAKDAITREGYTFVGWFDNKDKEYKKSFDMPSNDLTLIAKWEGVKGQTITFNPNGGILKAGLSATITAATGETVDVSPYLATDAVTLNKPTRATVKFLGWFDKDGKKLTKPSYIVPFGGVTFTAKWDDEETSGDGDGETPGDGDGETSGDGDGETPGDGDGETPGDGDGETPGDGDGETPGDSDGEVLGDSDDKTPGKDNVDKPGNNNNGNLPQTGGKVDQNGKKLPQTNEVDNPMFTLAGLLVFLVAALSLTRRKRGKQS